MMARTNNYHKAIVLLMAMLLALSVVGVSDAEAKKKKVKGDSVKGKILLAANGNSADIEFNAKTLGKGSSTDAAHGSIGMFASNGHFVVGEITCLRALDDKVYFLVRVDETSNPEQEGRFLEIIVSDSGRPKGLGDKFAFGDLIATNQCADPTEEDLDNGLMVAEGDILVKDGGGA